MDDKQKKQEELLTELESIKDLLDNDFLGDDTFIDPRAMRAQSDQDLLDQNTESSIEIPVLSEMVIEDEPLTKHPLEVNNEENQQESAPIEQEDSSKAPIASGVLPGQQSLFEKDRAQEKNSQKADTNSNENPFLPKHIRDRLTKPSDLEAILAGDTSKIEKPVVLPPIVKTTVEQDKSFFSSNSFLDEIQQGNKEQTLEDALKRIPDSQNTNTPDQRTPSNNDIDSLIDNLIAQYLPEIEAKLRFQLKQSLTKKPSEKTIP